mmetsp:Transcript_79990/g.159682  ORF Transcript_79990/g.159682 Transcript_79990/m.159682 type:complete len:362 (+) Transcript_79990:61-1146(+)
MGFVRSVVRLDVRSFSFPFVLKRPQQLLGRICLEVACGFRVCRVYGKHVRILPTALSVALPAPSTEPICTEPPAGVALDWVEEGGGKAPVAGTTVDGVGGQAGRQLLFGAGHAPSALPPFKPVLRVHRVFSLATVVERAAPLLSAPTAGAPELFAPQVVLHENEAEPIAKRKSGREPLNVPALPLLLGFYHRVEKAGAEAVRRHPRLEALPGIREVAPPFVHVPRPDPAFVGGAVVAKRDEVRFSTSLVFLFVFREPCLEHVGKQASPGPRENRIVLHHPDALHAASLPPAFCLEGFRPLFAEVIPPPAPRVRLVVLAHGSRPRIHRVLLARLQRFGREHARDVPRAVPHHQRFQQGGKRL